MEHESFYTKESQRYIAVMKLLVYQLPIRFTVRIVKLKSPCRNRQGL
jgi:hypothetical protein